MFKKETNALENRCHFTTERLSVSAWTDLYSDEVSKNDFHTGVIDILTPEVTKALPEGWQNINTTNQAQSWVKDRAEESHFVVVEERKSNKLVGFIFLYEMDSPKDMYELRFGYLLAESVWGKGLGTELIKALVAWCQAEGNIASLSGGVERDNAGSIKVLEKNGFSLSKDEDQSGDVFFYDYLFKTN